ncbi:MAG: DNA translocase FtsK, partial [Phycisphaerales bacterium]|nr:DNA translocase FtsK [Phycisphaerales bacterium]
MPTLTTRILWVLGAVAWLFVAASLASFDTADPPSHVVSVHAQPIGNLCGRAGALIAYNAWYLLGIGSWILLIGVGIAIGAGLSGRRITHPLVRSLGMLIVAVAGASLHGLIAPTWGPLAGAEPGLAAVATVGELTLRFGGLGTFLLIAAAMLVGLLLAEEQIILHLPRLAIRSFRAAHRVTVPQITNLMTRPETPLKEAGTARGAAKARGRWTSSRSAAAAAAIDPDAGGLGAVESFDPDDHEIDETDEVDEAPKSKRTKKAARPVVVDEDEYEDDEEDDEDEEYEEEDAYEEEEVLPGAPQVFSEDALREKISRLPVRFAQATQKLATEEDLQDLQNMAELAGYRFPGLDLLVDPEQNFSEELESLVRDQAAALEQALKQYRIDGSVEGIESGPVITLYHVRLAPGTKVANLNAVSSDLARSLKAINLRIVANMAGRDTVGIEVPNPKKEKVRMKELMSSTDNFKDMSLPMFLGKDASGDPLIADLTKMPHMLIAGTTGSGKSVCINTIIMSFLYTKKPNELKLVLVDPKMVEMSQFKDIPHLMCPVVTEMSKAAAILEWAVRKMDERY